MPNPVQDKHNIDPGATNISFRVLMKRPKNEATKWGISNISDLSDPDKLPELTFQIIVPTSGRVKN